MTPSSWRPFAQKPRGEGGIVKPSLLAISGPLSKSELPLACEVTIGRDADNNISLDDSAVAPHHCTIRLRGECFLVSDLDSPAGTFVNGIPITERALEVGDEIRVGNSVFLFQAERSGSSASSPVQMCEGEPLPAKSLELHRDELLNLQPESLAALPQPARLVRNFSVLLRISRSIGSLRDEDSLPWQLLGMIFDVIPAERGAIFLTEKDSLVILSQAAWDRVSGPDHPVEVSQELVRHVLEDGVSVLNRGAEEERSRPAVEHKEEVAWRALLCVPMISNLRPIGLIYLESRNPSTMFSQDDLQLLTAIAALGVMGIENARQFERLGNENQRLRAEVNLTHDMVGRSARMWEVYRFIERVAPSGSTVLICGESGTGKELAARAIHQNSPRKSLPFVALNCAALTETLLESELFGHEKGAFTSAVNLKKGYLEVAEGGTIFLDEIGELSTILQAKLLRVLQEREFVRVGGTRPIKINVRFLAATNKNLQKEVREQKFRPDLFHRLNVISTTLPALRERPEDIPALAEHFVARYARKCNREVTGISKAALDCLTQYDWPGNIRELENAMERAVVIGSSEKILPEDLPDTVLESAKGSEAAPAKYHQAIRNLKKQLILNALDQAGGHITEAAKLLGVHANYLHRLMRNLDLRSAMKKHTGL